MKWKAVSGIMVTLLLTSMLTLAVKVQQAEAVELPATQWTRTFGGSNYDASLSVQQTSDDGYIIAGYTDSYGAGDYDVYLIKTDSSGNKQWEKTFGGSYNDWGYSVQQTSDDGYIIAGSTSSYGAGDYDVYLIKTDSSGNKQWEKTFGGSDTDYGFSVQQTSDGGYIIAGMTEFYGPSERDVYLIKTDSSGNKQWNKTLGGSEFDAAWSVQQTSDDGYIIAGYTYSYGAGDWDVYLIKTDSSGNKQWEQIFGGSNGDYGYSVQQTSDDGYIIAGETRSYGAGGSDVYLVKTDSSGNMEWNKTFGGSNYDWGESVQQTSDGGYIIAGYTYSYGAGDWDVYLIKLGGENQLPVASFTYSPENPRVGEEITFDASSSYDPDGVIVSYFWDFGDESSNTGIIVTHAYAEAGEYNVTLTVTDDWALTNSTSKTVEVKVPVVLVHGYYSGPGTWNTLISHLEEHGYVQDVNLFTVDLAPGIAPANGDIKTYAKRLSTKIEEIGASKVDIVTHSMGGLVSRWYMEKCGGSDNVNKLIMLGTPNHGSELFHLRYFIPLMALLQHGWWMLGGVVLGEAAEQMTPDSDFLQSLGYSGKNNYYTIAGTKGFPITSWILKGGDDGFVRVASVELDGMSSQNQHKLHLDHFDYHTQNSSINQIIQILDDDSAVETQLMSAPMQTQQENQTLMEAPMVSGNILPGEQKHHEILVSATTEVTFALAWLDGNLSLTLTTPNDTVINSSVAETDPNITYYPSENITIEGYNIKNPEAGIWNVSVTAVDIAGEENYNVMTFLETNVTMSLSLQKHQYAPDELVNVKANLTKEAVAITNAVVTASIHKPDSTTENITLFDDGLHNDNQTNDGIYANTYTNTSLWGTYDITVTAVGTVDSEQFARETFTTVWVKQYPDLTLNGSDICFPEWTPLEGEMTTINATIHNIGEADAHNASILFYDGSPANGALIGECIINVTAGGIENASIQWNATLGTHQINVLISPYNEFLELNYTNNIAHRTIDVTIKGDVNGDGTVDTSDLIALSEAYGSELSKANWNPNCDFNRDNKVDVYDLSDLSKNYGKTA